jgi:hypothetical protein
LHGEAALEEREMIAGRQLLAWLHFQDMRSDAWQSVSSLRQQRNYQELPIPKDADILIGDVSEQIRQDQHLLIHSWSRPLNSSHLILLRCAPHYRKELLDWAGETSLETASFAYDFGADDLAKSVEGLFRSVLHQVLASEDKLFRAIFPGWSLPPEPPRFFALKAAIHRLKHQQLTNRKLVIFIDNMGKFTGTEFDRDIKALFELPSSHIKVVASWQFRTPPAIGKLEGIPNIACYPEREFWDNVEYHGENAVVGAAVAGVVFAATTMLLNAK